jgi:spermidine synthase
LTAGRAPARWLPLVVLLFFGSGAAALVYEIVWLQLLELFVGSSAVSVGVLLGTFMGGMCLGSLLLPRYVSARRHPLRVYAALELAIGVLGVALLFAMPLVGRVYTAWGGYGVGGFLLRGLVAALCLLPPTMAMGATLPAVARWVESTPTGMSWLGVFYAGNIAGATFGCLFAGFYLLRVHDMATATCVAAAINIEVAALAFLLSRTTASATAALPDAAGPAQPATGLEPAPGNATVLVAIALSGFCALAAEVVWTRLLALLLGATVYSFAIILAVYLLGLGIGSALGSLAARSLAHPRAALGWCQLLVVAAVAWSAAMLTLSLPYWPINVSISRSIWFNYQLDMARALWAILPAPILWGASFPLALAAVARPGRDPGRMVGGVYAANTLGAIAGALSASLLLIAWVGSQRAQQILMAASAAAGLVLLLPGALAAVRSRGPRGVGSALPLAAATAVAVLLMARVPPVPGILVGYGRYTATWLQQAGQMLFVREGLNASVAVSRGQGGLLQYHSAGKVQASSLPSDMRLQRMLGHLTTLLPRDPRSVLVIGCGAGVTAGAVSIDPRVERVTIAEIEPLVPRVVATYFGATNHDVVKNPKVRIVLDDARHFLLTSAEKFDAITSDPLDPWVKGAATLYTREFFEAARDHLNPGGVVTVFVQLYESSPEAVKSEVATFFQAFPRGVIWGNTHLGRGYDMVLLGQADPAPIDLDALDARLKDPRFAAVQRSLEEVGMGSAVTLLGTYAGRAVDLPEWMRDASINRDRDLRLQYLAGMGLNQYQSGRIYADIVRYRRFPEDLFTGSDALLGELRAAVERAPGGLPGTPRAPASPPPAAVQGAGR